MEFGLKWGPYDNHTQPRTNPHPQGGFGIDSRIGVAALRAPAASMEDSRPQAILKFQPRNSFNYRVRYEPQLVARLLNKNYFSNPIDQKAAAGYINISEGEKETYILTF